MASKPMPSSKLIKDIMDTALQSITTSKNNIINSLDINKSTKYSIASIITTLSSDISKALNNLLITVMPKLSSAFINNIKNSALNAISSLAFTNKTINNLVIISNVINNLLLSFSSNLKLSSTVISKDISNVNVDVSKIINSSFQKENVEDTIKKVSESIKKSVLLKNMPVNSVNAIIKEVEVSIYAINSAQLAQVSYSTELALYNAKAMDAAKPTDTSATAVNKATIAAETASNTSNDSLIKTANASGTATSDADSSSNNGSTSVIAQISRYVSQITLESVISNNIDLNDMLELYMKTYMNIALEKMASSNSSTNLARNNVTNNLERALNSFNEALSFVTPVVTLLNDLEKAINSKPSLKSFLHTIDASASTSTNPYRQKIVDSGRSDLLDISIDKFLTDIPDNISSVNTYISKINDAITSINEAKTATELDITNKKNLALKKSEDALTSAMDVRDNKINKLSNMLTNIIVKVNYFIEYHT